MVGWNMKRWVTLMAVLLGNEVEADTNVFEWDSPVLYCASQISAYLGAPNFKWEGGTEEATDKFTLRFRKNLTGAAISMGATMNVRSAIGPETKEFGCVYFSTDDVRNCWSAKGEGFSYDPEFKEGYFSNHGMQRYSGWGVEYAIITHFTCDLF